jgi:hypothetical protein
MKKKKGSSDEEKEPEIYGHAVRCIRGEGLGPYGPIV